MHQREEPEVSLPRSSKSPQNPVPKTCDESTHGAADPPPFANGTRGHQSALKTVVTTGNYRLMTINRTAQSEDGKHPYRSSGGLRSRLRALSGRQNRSWAATQGRTIPRYQAPGTGPQMAPATNGTQPNTDKADGAFRTARTMPLSIITRSTPTSPNSHPQSPLRILALRADHRKSVHNGGYSVGPTRFRASGSPSPCPLPRSLKTHRSGP